MSAKTWIEKLENGGSPSSIILKIPSVISSPQAESMKMLVNVDHPTIENLRLPRLPVQLSETPLEITKSPPLLGEDTLNILKESGVAEETIQELIKKSVIQIHSNHVKN